MSPAVVDKLYQNGCVIMVIMCEEELSYIGCASAFQESSRLRGPTVARLTPDQKVACSNHVGVIVRFFC